jgi:hypothetical protein
MLFEQLNVKWRNTASGTASITPHRIVCLLTNEINIINGDTISIAGPPWLTSTMPFTKSVALATTNSAAVN